MIKILHFIKLGQFNLTDVELMNLDSWKRIYPDFEIKYWSDENLGDMIDDCPYIKKCYQYGYFGFVSDYLRLKVVYLYGGMYMDTDVFCLNRIPDYYFEKPFIPFSPEFCTINTCTGTATFAPKPKMRIFNELLDRYRTIEGHDTPEEIGKSEINNKYIDRVFYKFGFNTDDSFGCSLKDQDLGVIRIVNRIQFGFTDFRGELPMTKYAENKTIYLMHNYMSSWGVKNSYKQSELWYIVIRDDTDIRKVGNWVQSYWGYTSGVEGFPKLMIFINSSLGKEEEFIVRMRILNCKDAFDMRKDLTWRTAYMGSGLTPEEEYNYINCYLLTRTPDILSVKEISI